MLKSKVFLITILILSLLSIFIVQKKDVIFQEGNPIPLAMAISKIIFQNKEIESVTLNWTDSLRSYRLET